MRAQLVRRPRWILAAPVAILVCALAVPPVRTSILRSVGWALVVNDLLVPADIVVVTVDVNSAGLLEAADLVHSGVVARVAVFMDPPDEVDRELIRRGVPYEDAAARSIRQLQSLGVQAIEIIPRAVAGTGDEGHVLPGWCDEARLRSVIVVGRSDHSRRLRRVLRRAMDGHHTRVAVRFARYSQFDPERWWQTRTGMRTGIVELQKLLLDLALHPIS